MNKKITIFICVLLGLLFPVFALASSGDSKPLNLNMTDTAIGISALCIFMLAYCAVMGEEFLHLRKSKPVVLAAGVIWGLIAWSTHSNSLATAVEAQLRDNILEYAELLLFLLVAMTYVNAMAERQVFEALRAWLVRKGLSYRQLFWITGILAFFISPIADNLTTALLMCAVVMAVGADNPRFVAISCVNIVVAANAGGAFSPFGDITTLMVWQKGILPFADFFAIFIPSVVNFLIPATIMHFAIPKLKPDALDEQIKMRRGAKRIILLFLITITTAVSFHQVLHLPPAIGMMTGFALLQFFAYYLKMSTSVVGEGEENPEITNDFDDDQHHIPFDIFRRVERAEWDTLLFFYGVILCVGGLATLGYLGLLSQTMYQDWGASLAQIHAATPANITVGVLSSIVDNIPVMFSVLTMNPSMSEGQWLLVTLTAGVGGSMLSVGSAAGVALMGQTKGRYTFFSHLKWTWAIALGYAAAIYVHIWINADLFYKTLT